jgi:hypothetical protein
MGNRQIKNGQPHYYTGQVRADHFDHVHWAMDRGGVASGLGYFGKFTRAPERVLDPRQTMAFERLVASVSAGGGAGGNVVNFNFPNYFGPQDALMRELVALDRAGRLDSLLVKAARAAGRRAA